MMNFANPYLLLLIPLALTTMVIAMRRRKAFGHSQIKTQKDLRTFSITGYIPAVLLATFVVLIGLALARPVVPEYHDISVIQTRDFCLEVDISGSMSSEIVDPDQVALAKAAADAAKANGTAADTTSSSTSPAPAKITRLTVAQSAIDTFVKSRQGDRVCLMYFDDEAYNSWPLTTDMNTILKRNKRTSGFSGGGTNFQGPTDSDPRIGPIQAALNHFRENGQAKSKIIMMITDGEDNISPQRMTELAAQFKADNVRVYVLGIAEGWVGNSDQTKDLRKLAEDSGGAVMVVGNAADMRKGIEQINNLEKSRVEIERSTSFKDVYQYFLLFALLAGLLYLVAASAVREDV